MLNQCMTPGCQSYAPPHDVLCITCRQQSNNSMSVAYFPIMEECREFVPSPVDLSDDLAQIAAYQVREMNRLQAVVSHQQEQLTAQAKTINDLGHRLSHRLREVDYERARADGLQQQVDGLRGQLWALGAEPVQPAPNGRQAHNDPKPRRLSRWLRAVMGG